jgi:hypothetical protein
MKKIDEQDHPSVGFALNKTYINNRYFFLVYRIPTFEDFYIEEFIPFKTGVLEKMTRIEDQVMKIEKRL